MERRVVKGKRHYQRCLRSLSWSERHRSHGEASCIKRVSVATLSFHAEGGFELMVFPAVGTQETSRLGSVPPCSVTHWPEPLLQVFGIHWLIHLLQPTGPGRDFPGDNGPLKEPAERQDSGPQSISEGWRQRRTAAFISHFSATSGKSLSFSQGSKVLLENSWFSRIVWPVPLKQTPLRAELTYSLSSSTPAPQGTPPSMNFFSKWLQVQTLALVKTCLALMLWQYLCQRNCELLYPHQQIMSYISLFKSNTCTY